MSPENRKKLARLLLVASPLVALDQASKWLIQKTIPLYEAIPVIPGFFDLTHAHNTGGAFGMFADHGPLVRVILFLVLTVAAAVMVLWLYHRTPLKDRLFGWALCLIFAGAVGNLVDRFRFGYVDDFLLLHAGRFQWPAFNVADSAVSVGVTILVIHVLFGKEPF